MCAAAAASLELSLPEVSVHARASGMPGAHTGQTCSLARLLECINFTTSNRLATYAAIAVAVKGA